LHLLDSLSTACSLRLSRQQAGGKLRLSFLIQRKIQDFNQLDKATNVRTKMIHAIQHIFI